MKSLLVLLLTLGSLSAHADPIEIFKGPQKEAEIRWVWKYLGDFAQACLTHGRECQDPSIKPVLTQLLPLLTKPAAARARQLSFLSERARPDLFRVSTHEAHRVAVTENTPGSLIYLNQDRLDMPLSAWVGLLVHESVHHLGYPDDNSRLPDRLGAAVAAYIASVWHESTLEEFAQPGFRVVIFSDPSGAQAMRALVSTNITVSDNDALPSSRVPVCEQGETFLGQTASAPLWRVMHFHSSGLRIRVRGSSLVQNRCRQSSGTVVVRKTNFSIIAALVYQTPVDPQGAWWEQPSVIEGDLMAGNNDGPEEDLDIYRTFHIESIKDSQETYHPGEIWKREMIVESSEPGFQPKTCNAYLTASRWFVHRNGIGLFDSFQTCEFKSLGANRWHVTMAFTFPREARPDLFSLAFVAFYDGRENRFALASKPQFVRIENPRAPVALKATHWRVQGLKPKLQLGNAPLKNSFFLEKGQQFWLELDFKGTQKPLRQFLDFDFIVKYQGSAILMPRNVQADKMPDQVLETQIVPFPGGFTIRYRMTLPATLSGVEALGFKWRRITVETDDYSWTETELPNLLEAMFVPENFSL